MLLRCPSPKVVLKLIPTLASQVVKLGVFSGFSVGEGGIESAGTILIIGGHLGEVQAFAHHSSHETEGEVHHFFVAQGFVVVHCGQQVSGGEANGTCFVVERLQSNSDKVISLPTGILYSALKEPVR